MLNLLQNKSPSTVPNAHISMTMQGWNFTSVLNMYKTQGARVNNNYLNIFQGEEGVEDGRVKGGGEEGRGGWEGGQFPRDLAPTPSLSSPHIYFTLWFGTNWLLATVYVCTLYMCFLLYYYSSIIPITRYYCNILLFLLCSGEQDSRIVTIHFLQFDSL